MRYRPLVEVGRGRIIESVHFGAFAVSDSQGVLQAALGQTDFPVFLRSSAKPFQALPLVEAGAAKSYALTARQIALICASHCGTDEHVRVLRSIQEAAGVKETDLQCGVHPPLDRETADRILRESIALTPNRHNCSGKHTGMLALCRFLGADMQEYLSLDHPVQRKILETMCDVFELEEGQIELGTDGCSAPNFAVPLAASAKAYARMADPGIFPQNRADACREIWQAMTQNPVMVSGEGRFDTELMKVGQGRILSKGGAEGFQALAVAPDAWGSGNPATGIALKIADGDARSRARAVVVLELLRQLQLVPEDLLAPLVEQFIRPLTNWRGIEVGRIRPSFHLVE